MILPEEVHVVQKVCFVKKVKEKIQIKSSTNLVNCHSRYL